MTNEEFDTRRRNAKITCAELADVLGCNVRWMIGVVELGDEAISPSMISVLNDLIAKKVGR